MEPLTETHNQTTSKEDLIGLFHPISWALGAYLVLMGIGLSVLLVKLWPHVALVHGNAEPCESASKLTILGVEVCPQSHLILLAMLMGALGSYLHVTGSYVLFVGNRELAKSWAWWYLLWPLMGAVLAVVVYFACAAGFVAVNDGQTKINPNGVAAISAMAGMFAKVATDKIREIFETMFRVRDPAVTKDKPGNTVGKPSTKIATAGEDPKVNTKIEGP